MNNKGEFRGDDSENIPEALQLNDADWEKEEEKVEEDYFKKYHAWLRSLQDKVKAGAFAPYIQTTRDVEQTYVLEGALERAREDLKTSSEKLRIEKQIQEIEAILAEKNQIAQDQYHEAKAMREQRKEEAQNSKRKK